MPYFVGIDCGSNAGFGLIIGNKAWGYACSNAEERAKAFDILRGIAFGSYGKDGVIAMEQLHSMHTFGHERNFTFGTNVGFWKGILAFLSLSYVEVAPVTWQLAMTRKPARPDVKGWSKKAVDKAKREHKKALKAESLRSACAAFPTSSFPSHDVADAVNIARYLKLQYEKENPNMTTCTGPCMKTAGTKLKVMKAKKAVKGKKSALAKKAGVSSKGAVKIKGKNLPGGVY